MKFLIYDHFSFMCMWIIVVMLSTHSKLVDIISFSPHSHSHTNGRTERLSINESMSLVSCVNIKAICFLFLFSFMRLKSYGHTQNTHINARACVNLTCSTISMRIRCTMFMKRWFFSRKFAWAIHAVCVYARR